MAFTDVFSSLTCCNVFDTLKGQKTIDIGYWNMRMYKLTLINLINYMGSPVLNIRQLTSLFASLFRRDEVKMIRYVLFLFVLSVFESL